MWYYRGCKDREMLNYEYVIGKIYVVENFVD